MGAFPTPGLGDERRGGAAGKGAASAGSNGSQLGDAALTKKKPI